MGLGDRIAGVIRRWLKVDPAWRSIDNVRIREQYTYETDAMRDRIWYRGDADELRQFYGQVSSDSSGSRVRPCARCTAACRRRSSTP